MIIDCISDLHGHYPELEGGDLLIIAGDLTARDSPEEIGQFITWAVSRAQKQYKKVIFIAGNHDNFIYEKYIKSYKTYQHPSLMYLCDSGTEFEGLKIWGSPWTLAFEGMNPDCKAFTCETEEQLAEKWAMIPDDVGILVTHSPPHGCYLDQDRDARMLGSVSLRDRIYPFTKFKPILHVFGHIHEGYGIHPIKNSEIVNASHVNEHYKPVNKPIRAVL